MVSKKRSILLFFLCIFFITACENKKDETIDKKTDVQYIEEIFEFKESTYEIEMVNNELSDERYGGKLVLFAKIDEENKEKIIENMMSFDNHEDSLQVEEYEEWKNCYKDDNTKRINRIKKEIPAIDNTYSMYSITHYSVYREVLDCNFSEDDDFVGGFGGLYEVAIKENEDGSMYIGILYEEDKLSISTL